MGLFRKKTADAPPPPPTVDPAELASLRAEMASLQERLDASERSKAVLEERVEVLDGRLAEERLAREMATTVEPPPPPVSSPTPPPPPASLDETPPVGMIRVDDLAARVDELAALLDTGSYLQDADDHDADDAATEHLRGQLEAVTNRLDALDLRVTNVSTELANQLTELSRDIEQFAEQRADVDASTVDAVQVDTAELEARLAERLDLAIDEVNDSTERLAAEQARYQIQFRQDLAELADRLRRPGAT